MRLTRGRRHLDEQRLEQPLALETRLRQPLRDALEEHALVGHVLVDDGDAILVDRDDEALVQLGDWTDLTR